MSQKTKFEQTICLMKTSRFENIICYGEILWDEFPTGAVPGGAPLNVAFHLKKQGKDPTLVSKIGKDRKGQELLQFIKNSGLNSEYIQEDENLDTGKVSIQLDKVKNATFKITEPVAWDNIQFNERLKKLATEADLIVFGSLATRNETSRKTLLEMFEASEATRLFDVNLRPPYDNPEVIEELISLSDIIKLNDDELIKIASWRNESGKIKKLIKWFSEFYGCSDIYITKGANGAVFYTENHFYEHPGFKVNVTDTVGAGDSFLASLISNLAENRSPAKSIENACATGAFVAAQKGAVPEYSQKEVEIIKKSLAK